jgi:hypothetical protein
VKNKAIPNKQQESQKRWKPETGDRKEIQNWDWGGKTGRWEVWKMGRLVDSVEKSGSGD